MMTATTSREIDSTRDGASMIGRLVGLIALSALLAGYSWEAVGATGECGPNLTHPNLTLSHRCQTAWKTLEKKQARETDRRSHKTRDFVTTAQAESLDKDSERQLQVVSSAKTAVGRELSECIGFYMIVSVTAEQDGKHDLAQKADYGIELMHKVALFYNNEDKNYVDGIVHNVLEAYKSDMKTKGAAQALNTRLDHYADMCHSLGNSEGRKERFQRWKRHYEKESSKK